MRTKGVTVDYIRETNDDFKNKLRRNGIETINSFLCLVESEYCFGGLRELLEIGARDLRELKVKADQSIRKELGFPYVPPKRSNRKYPLNDSSFAAIRPSITSPLTQAQRNGVSPKADLRKFMTPVQDQGERHTCIPFAISAIYESYYLLVKKSHLNLSTQCLYYQCKQLDLFPDTEGTSILCAIDVLKKYGVCESSQWPYSGKKDANNVCQLPQPENCQPFVCKRTQFRKFRIKDYVGLSDIIDIKWALDNNHAVYVEIPAYKSWLQYNTYTEQTGEINLPLPNDFKKTLGNHAICLAGYDDKTNSFFFKNCWGKKWAKNSTYEEGYGTLPYEYISKYGIFPCYLRPDLS